MTCERAWWSSQAHFWMLIHHEMVMSFVRICPGKVYKFVINLQSNIDMDVEIAVFNGTLGDFRPTSKTEVGIIHVCMNTVNHVNWIFYDVIGFLFQLTHISTTLVSGSSSRSHTKAVLILTTFKIMKHYAYRKQKFRNNTSLIHMMMIIKHAVDSGSVTVLLVIDLVHVELIYAMVCRLYGRCQNVFAYNIHGIKKNIKKYIVPLFSWFTATFINCKLHCFTIIFLFVFNTSLHCII